ncbi:hypothetical protein IW261DRAFT_1417890 [Armillaria novae-zelandiae]|uniref:Uncharacterized protein n=1 Tax=Armillaria novae-zelandiae TaxID=153914 RepID=A0AA39PDK7_9AGAR|nr:hypothetical protein IW261DRAFT_1417890 [Armillaria novae-zelandiae]
MSAPQTQFAPTQSSSVLGGQIVGRSERAPAPPASVKLRLDLNLEVEIAIQAKVNGDITLSLLVVHANMNVEVSESLELEVLRAPKASWKWVDGVAALLIPLIFFSTGLALLYEPKDKEKLNGIPSRMLVSPAYATRNGWVGYWCIDVATVSPGTSFNPANP